ncbi:hypothetical protein [Streptomyces chartreusis]|uniref:hypothetical protein n=1 Tax=Streptomyces chartreusis TaxID=1969 RepID=UPI00380F3C73
MVGIVAGIGSLLFTAVATYYAAAVSKDQLDQSREDAIREERDQAARVAAWVETDRAGSMRVHLMNRSLDPVSAVALSFWVSFPDRLLSSRWVYVLYSQPVVSVGPCTELVFDQGSMEYVSWVDGFRSQKKVPSRGLYADVIRVEFMDRTGVKWVRDRKGLDRVTGSFGPVDRHGRALGLVEGRPTSKEASSCR